MIFNLKESFIRMAVKEAQKSNYYPQRLGCVIFDKNIILSIGHNQIGRNAKNLHPNFQEYKGSIHAEIATILKAKKNLIGSDLLIIRINNNLQFRLAKPCVRCMDYIKYVRIRKVYYSTSKYPYFEMIKIRG